MKNLFFIVVVTLTSVLAVPAQAPPTSTQAPYVRPDAEKRFKRFVGDTVGPFAWVGVAAGAGFSTISNEPEEWGRSVRGFGKRAASSFGKNVVRNTMIYAMDEALKVDSHFYRSQKRDVGGRIADAFLSTVTSRRPNGKRTVGAPRIIGSYASSVIAAEAWYPPRYNWKDGMKSGTISLGTNAIFNLVREFILKK